MTLHTEKNIICDNRGKKVILHGVNCSALEWSIVRASRLEACIVHAIDNWNSNVIRLPLSPCAWFGMTGEQRRFDMTADDYRNRVEKIVDLCASKNTYIILDLHGAGENGSLGRFKSPMPDLQSIEFWQSVSARFANVPNVLFGLFNEPRDIGERELFFGGEVTLEGKTYNTVGMKTLLETVRKTGAKNICVIGGTDWAFDLRPWLGKNAIADGEGNGIVLDSHIYPWKDTDWEEKVGSVMEKYPVIIGEFGHYGDAVVPREAPNNLKCDEYFERIFAFIKKHDVGFLAWDFNRYAGPSLIKSHETFEPTEFFGVKFKDFIKKY